MAQELPYELQELICGHLEASSLLSYSLTCRRFRSIALQTIFSRVELRYPRPGRHTHGRTEDLLEILPKSTDICEAVRTVSLLDARRVQDRDAPPDMWRDESLLSVLGYLKNIQCFIMDNTSYATAAWDLMPLVMQDALTNIFHSNSLTSLFLCRVSDLPLSVLDGCGALENLILISVWFQKEELSAVPGGLQRPRNHLKSLHIDSLADFRMFSTWITSSTCGLSISKLEELLLLVVKFEDNVDVNRILRSCASTLQVFCFQPAFVYKFADVDDGVPSVPINSTMLTSLRILRVRFQSTMPIVSRDMNILSSPTCLSWILHFFSQLSNKNTITEISLKFNLVSFTIHNPLTGAAAESWRRLGTLLAPHVARSLRRFTFIMSTGLIDAAGHLEEDINQSLSDLKEANVLNVVMTETVQGFLSTDDRSLPMKGKGQSMM
ncbi:hypothetical protein BDN70DRAFT_237832 [Pholiota conissans]|uniref:F-box domain-containing protein n=1 Tax=Pholiota conissans TaxID=109636 RepID=A0A9P5ZEX8_9AGAR|nr:hypothetical protein BDN70DRAFT_237832 [Pholiota conissans]